MGRRSLGALREPFCAGAVAVSPASRLAEADHVCASVAVSARAALGVPATDGRQARRCDKRADPLRVPGVILHLGCVLLVSVPRANRSRLTTRAGASGHTIDAAHRIRSCVTTVPSRRSPIAPADGLDLPPGVLVAECPSLTGSWILRAAAARRPVTLPMLARRTRASSGSASRSATSRPLPATVMQPRVEL